MLVWVSKTCVFVYDDELVEKQKFENDANEFNWLITNSETELVIYTSSGKFYVLQTDKADQKMLMHSFYCPKELSAEDSQKSNAHILDFEAMNEVSCIKLFQDYLLVSYWDSDSSIVLANL